MPWWSNNQDREKHIRIRPYRSSDSEQVRGLFKVGLLYESTSPFWVAYMTQTGGPTACLSYCALLLGLLLANFLTCRGIRYIGIALSITGCTLFAVFRLTLLFAASNYVKQALNGDLKDIDKTFGMESVANYNGRIPSGPSGFWVAEAYEKGSEMNKTEVIGFIGLDANTNSEKTTAELRRMVVSPDYRRRKVATSLVIVALQHARNHGVTSVVLSTSMFQPVAIAMYEGLGWVRQKEVGVRIVLDRVWIFFYSLDLTTAEI